MAYVSPGGGYNPTMYAPKLLTKYYKQTILSKIMDTEYEGILKKAGDTVKIRRRPTITGGTYNKGGTVTYGSYATTSQELVIDQTYLWSFAVDVIDETQTDLKGFINDWIDEAVTQQRIYVETQILNAAPGVVVAANKGLTAGAESESFNLGTIAVPLHVTGKETYTSTEGIKYYNAADLMADFCTVLRENKCPMESEIFAILPPFVRNRISKSELKNQYASGDGTPVIRKGPDYIGEVQGVNTYSSLNLTASTTGGENGDLKVYPIIFGVKEGWTFAAQIDHIKSFDLHETCAMGHRGLFVWGWAQKIQEGLGVAYVTAEDKK